MISHKYTQDKRGERWSHPTNKEKEPDTGTDPELSLLTVPVKPIWFQDALALDRENGGRVQVQAQHECRQRQKLFRGKKANAFLGEIAPAKHGGACLHALLMLWQLTQR